MLFPRTSLIAGWIAAGLLVAPLAGVANDGTPMPLDGVLNLPTLWEMEGGAFVEQNKELGFRWISSTQDVAQNVKSGASLYGLPVCQTLVRIKEGKVDHITAMFFNRGDMGELRKAQYDDLLRRVVTAISTAVGSQPKERGRDASSAVKAYGLEWATKDGDFLLEYSFTRENLATGTSYRAEFIRLEISPKEAPKSFLAEAFSSTDRPEKYDGPKQVVRDAESGDVYIKEVPMVDQGDKGYCVVASVERVMRLYGVRVDANELAQLANSSASEGTSVDAMTDSLKKLSARLKIRVRTQIDFDYPRFTRFIDEYNRQARRAKENPISLGGRQTLTGIFGNMKPDLIREAKSKNKGEFNTFQRHVKTQVDRGIPLVWSMIYGVMPENGSPGQGLGGHSRLIIGYNEKTAELIYSDSWGARHEFKKMPLFDAFCVTMALSTIEQQ